jgi:hypothetical protein
MTFIGPGTRVLLSSDLIVMPSDPESIRPAHGSEKRNGSRAIPELFHNSLSPLTSERCLEVLTWL